MSITIKYKEKSRCIEALLLGIHAPPIYMTTRNSGRWQLLYNLPTIMTVLSFFGAEYTLDYPSYFILKDVTLVSKLNGVAVTNLPFRDLLKLKETKIQIHMIASELKIQLFTW